MISAEHGKRLRADPILHSVRVKVTLLIFGVAVLPIAILCAFGTPFADALLGLGYELVLVAIPGWILYAALVPDDGNAIRHLAIGWPLGVAVEFIAFNLTAALDLRDAMPLLVLLVVAVSLLRHATRRRIQRNVLAIGRAVEGLSTMWFAIFVGLFAAVLLALAGAYFLTQPLPDSVAAVQYYVDVPFHLSLVAEAANHWPMRDPNIAGDPLHYHTFSHMHMAAIHQITGVDNATVLLRIFVIAPLLASLLLLVALAQMLGTKARVGLMMFALLFLAGELDFDGSRSSPFLGLFVSDFWFSPSLTLAVPLFFGSLLMITTVWDKQRKFAPTSVTILFLILCALGGAKGSGLPVLGLGLAICFLWERLRGNRIGRSELTTLFTVGAAFAVTYAALYAGGPNQLELGGATFVTRTIVGPPGDLALTLSPVERLAVSPALLALMMLSLAGVVWRLVHSPPLATGERLMLALLAASASFFVVLDHVGLSQLYFLFFGYAAAVAVSAIGLTQLYWVLCDRGVLHLAAIGGGIGFTFCGIATLLTAGAAGEVSERYFIVLGALLGSLLLAAALATMALFPDGRLIALSAILIPGALTASAFNTVVDTVVPLAKAYPGTLYAPPQPPGTRGLSDGLADALRWTREETPESAVLAVSNQQHVRGDPRYFLYAGLGERRTFLGGWGYSDRAIGGDANGIAERGAATLKLLRASNCAKLSAALHDAPADYAFYDRYNTDPLEKLGQVVGAVFSNADAAIYDLHEASAAC